MKAIIIVGVVVILCVAGGVATYLNRFMLIQYLPSVSSDNYSAEDGLITKNEITGEVFSGRLRTEFISEKDKRVEIYSYKDGKLHGINVAYLDGKIKESGIWKDGMQHGRFRLYSDEGVLIDDGYFKKGERDGVTKQYYHSGKLKVNVTFKNGVFDGMVNEYYEDGNKRLEIAYDNGTKNGVAREFYPGGKVRVELSYINDVANGDYTMYKENGDISTKGIFTNGEFQIIDNAEDATEEK